MRCKCGCILPHDWYYDECRECLANNEKKTTPCPGCERMTKSIRKSRAKYLCKECNHDKSLSEVFWYEATHKPTITEKQREQQE